MECIKFEYIENYDLAVEARLTEFKNINKLRDNFEILLMHLGGIIIECYLKKIIIDKKKIKYSADCNCYWFDDKGLDVALAYKQVSNSQKKRLKVCNNPSHDIGKAINEIYELRELMADNERIIECINIVQKPLEDSTYIDLRYKSSKEYSHLNEKFQVWFLAFRELFVWIKNNKQYIEVD